MMEILPKEIDRIDRIVESLLGFARSTVPKIESISLEEILEDNLKYYGEQAEKNGVKIVRQYAALPRIQGDKDQLGQVFSNLILNAIQAMPEGGELKVQTREGKKTENILESIKIDISDTGHGIPEENLKHLFDPFFTTKYAGTGLGLTITHSIVDGHRGYIDVKSEIGKGTAFTVTLPVSQELL
jgi:two-component system NtrC family sensor kinase